MIRIAGDIAGGGAFYFAGSVREAIPDGFTFAVFVPAAFDLVRGGGGAPEKVFWKLKGCEGSFAGGEFAEEAMAGRIEGETGGGTDGCAEKITTSKRAKLPAIQCQVSDGESIFYWEFAACFPGNNTSRRTRMAPMVMAESATLNEGY